jgi:hypothetical protein
MLGEMKQDYSLYEQAWELSEGKYSKAMRLLGRVRFE